MASQYIKLPPATGGGPAPGVDSFNARTGVVVSQAGDYAAGLIGNVPAGNIAATTVQGAINELDTEKQAVITGAATSITSANLTADRAVISNGSGKVAVSAVTSTELATLSGIASSIQTQLNGKQPLDTDLTAVAGLASTGLIARTGAGTAATRTITGTPGEITVTNGDGVSGNPTLALTATGATPGTYTNPTVTVSAKGRILAITNGSLPTVNPNLSRVISDDFIANTVAAGAYAWTINNSGTGSNATIVTTHSDVTERALGVMQQTTGSTTTGRSVVTSGLTSLATQIASMRFNFRCALNSYGTVPDQYEFTFGGIDNTAAGTLHTDGVYFRFTGNGVNTIWDCVTSAAGVHTITSSGVVATLDQFQLFEIFVNEAATSVQFFINGVLVATHTTNIPQVADRFGVGSKIVKTAGINPIVAFVDYIYLNLEWSGPR